MTAATIVRRRLGGVGDGGLNGMNFPLKKRSLKRETDDEIFASVHSGFYPDDPEEKAKLNSPLMQSLSSSQTEYKFGEWVELANGCVCCTVKHLCSGERKDRLDHILLETTGLVNPAPLACVLRDGLYSAQGWRRLWLTYCVFLGFLNIFLLMLGKKVVLDWAVRSLVLHCSVMWSLPRFACKNSG